MFEVGNVVRILKGDPAGHIGRIVYKDCTERGVFFVVLLDYPRILHRHNQPTEIWRVRCSAEALELIQQA